MGDFRKLRVWQHSHSMVRTVYRLTESLSARERYGMSAQMRRAALSVSSNLAEGCGRRSDRELRRYIRISLGSLAELECQILLAQDLAMLPGPATEDLLTQMHRVGAMLERLHARLGVASPSRHGQAPRPVTPRLLDP